MKKYAFVFCLIILLASPHTTVVHGHGSPIHIKVEGGKLTTSGGLFLTSGFSMKAFDPSEDAGLDFPGQTVRTDFPGFDVEGSLGGASLQLEILARHDRTDLTKRPRWLWYWDSNSQQVAVAEHDPDFRFRRIDLQGSLTIDQFSQPADSVLTVSDSIIPNAHQHYLRYELDNSPAAAFGVYGAFARVRSPGLEASEPFLLAFGYGVGVDAYAEGALAINRAAGPRGDYDLDGDVDGHDFLAWQRTQGEVGLPPADGSLNGQVDADDLEIWQQNYGSIFDEGILLAAAQVPEPTGLIIASAMIAVFCCRI